MYILLYLFKRHCNLHECAQTRRAGSFFFPFLFFFWFDCSLFLSSNYRTLSIDKHIVITYTCNYAPCFADFSLFFCSWRILHFRAGLYIFSLSVSIPWIIFFCRFGFWHYLSVVCYCIRQSVEYTLYHQNHIDKHHHWQHQYSRSKTCR